MAFKRCRPYVLVLAVAVSFLWATPSEASRYKPRPVTVLSESGRSDQTPISYGNYQYGGSILLPRSQQDASAPIITGALGRRVSSSSPSSQRNKINSTTGSHNGDDNDNEHYTAPQRLEIRTLRNDPAAWTLYILGISMLHWENQSEPTSWYQLAGTC